MELPTSWNICFLSKLTSRQFNLVVCLVRWERFQCFTSYDQTVYFGTVERDKLKALLVLEADRMQNALINAEQLLKRVFQSCRANNPDYRLSRRMRAAFQTRLWVGGTGRCAEVYG